jgi:hypothetical protein
MARIKERQGTLREATRHVLIRAAKCIDVDGGIFENILWDSSVGVATGYGLDDQGGGRSSPGRIKNFYVSISSRPALGSAQPFIKWVPGVKRQGREADHSPPTSAEVKKMWIYTYTSSWCNA